MKTGDKDENIKITLDSTENASAVIKVSIVSMLRPWRLDKEEKKGG